MVDTRSCRTVIALNGSAKARRRRKSLAAAIVCVTLGIPLSQSTFGASATWNGTTDANWATGTNWSTGTAPGVNDGGVTTTSLDVATFNNAGNAKTTIVVDANRNILGITFDTATAAAYTLNTGPLLLTSGGLIQLTTTVAKTETINAPLVLEGANGAYTFTNNSTSTAGILVFGAGGITGGGAGTTTLTLNGTNTTANTISGIIADNATTSTLLAISKSGTGLWLLSGANTFSGGLTLAAGTLDLNNAKAPGTGAITLTGGTLDTTAAATTLSNNNAENWNGDFAFTGTKALNLGTGPVTLSANRQVTVNGTAGNGILTAGGVVSGAGAATFNLTKAGTGVLVLSNTANTYGGATTINNGALSIAALGSLGGTSGANVTVTAPGAINFIGATDPSATGLYSRITPTSTGSFALNVSSAVNIDFNGAGFTQLGLGALANTAITYTGTLAPMASGNYYVGNGGGTITFSNANAFTGANNLIVNPSAGTTTLSTVTLSNSNNYTGTTTLGGGILVVSNALAVNTAQPFNLTNSGATLTVNSATTFAGSFNLSNNAAGNTLTLNGTGNVTVNGVITDGTVGTATSAITYSGSGTLTLNTANTFKGGLNIASGSAIVALGNDAALGNGGQVNLNAAGVTIESADASTRTIANTVNLSTNATFGAAGSGAGSGELIFNGPVLGGNNPKQITINNALTIFNGVINDGGAPGANVLTKAGPGTAVFANAANTNTKPVVILGGILSINTLANGGVASGLGKQTNASTGLILNGGTLQYTGPAVSTDRLFSVGTAGGSLDASGSGAVNFAGVGTIGFNAQVTGVRTLTLTGTSAALNTLNVTVADTATGATNATSLSKTGAGTWVLTGPNVYSGGTTITGGTLLANGATSGTSSSTGLGQVNVNANGTLGGSGTIELVAASANTVAVGANATLAPGLPGSTGSILTVADGKGVNFGSNASFNVKTATAPTSDRLAIIGGGLLNIASNNSDVLNVSATNTGTFTIATWVGGTRTGFFGSAFENGVAEPLTPGATSGGITTFTAPDLTLTYDDNANQLQLNITNVVSAPEPASAGLCAFAACGLLLRKRRVGSVG